ncbi:MAG TPA: ParA family protein [Pyrinomonadaceae bacterium]|nr:ParA family protein [Pyrinomonadaceae bacterium]
MKTIAIANQKGGVGKTTTAATLATELAIRDYETLLIDADPQGNATQIFFSPDQISATLSDVLLGGGSEPAYSLEEKGMTTAIPHLDMVAATINLAKFERESPLAITKLRIALRNVSSRYDFAIIDTPPNLGLLLTATLTAADYVIIPVKAAPFALNGLQDLLDAINGARSLNENLKVLGTICTMFDKRMNVSGNSLLELREKSGDWFFETVIHAQAKLEESPSVHQPIQVYAPNSRGALQYAELTEEILARMGVAANASHLGLVSNQ